MAILVASFVGAYGCGGPSIRTMRARGYEGDAVAERAKVDLGCRWITVVHLGGDDFGADGCGLQATYTVVCGDGEGQPSCIAALNQQIR
jgi:hypothetical protein